MIAYGATSDKIHQTVRRTKPKLRNTCAFKRITHGLHVSLKEFYATSLQYRIFFCKQKNPVSYKRKYQSI